MAAQRPVRSSRNLSVYYGDQMETQHEQAKKKEYLDKFSAVSDTSMFLNSIQRDKKAEYLDLLKGKLLFYKDLKHKQEVMARLHDEDEMKIYDKLHDMCSSVLLGFRVAIEFC